MLDPFKNIDKELLLQQKTELYRGLLNKGHIDPEVLEGVLGLLDAVTDNIDTINNTELCTCGDCSYTGNIALWEGTAYLCNDRSVPIKGNVPLRSGTFEIDALIEELENKDEVDSFDGDSYCPFCRSNNIQ